MEEEKKYHLLVVDDDADVAASLSEVLQESGYEVSIAVDGLDGLNHLFEDPKRPDLILLDLMMPRMNGFAFLRAVEHTEFNTIPVILISGADPQEVKDAHVKKDYIFVSKTMLVYDILSTIHDKIVTSNPGL